MPAPAVAHIISACPFCASVPALAFEVDTNEHTLTHDETHCPLSLEVLAHDDLAELVAWWNQRVAPDDATIERIIKACKERRFLMSKHYSESGPDDNGNLYHAIRAAFLPPTPED